MLVLALDTTSRAGSAAVTRGDETVACLDGDPTRTHGERLPAEIAQVLDSARVAKSQIELLAIGRGPGAFTGLRIGLAAVQGLAMALGLKVVGVSTFDAIAAAVGPLVAPGAQRLEIWVDAQRGEVFRQRFQRAGGDWPHWEPLGDPVVDAPADALAAQDAGAITFSGDGALRYQAAIAARQGRLVPPPQALAPYIARIAWRRARLGLAGAPHGLQPLYVRRPDAEVARLAARPYE